MMKSNNKQISKLMSLVLRHQPEYIGVQLDEEGWLSIDELLAGMKRKGIRVDRKLLEEVVRTNDKQRFKISEDGNYIRANQGHSIEVNLDFVSTTPPEILFHGTVDRFIPAIRKEGLKRMSRNHVHLSADMQTAQKVGSRRGKPVLLRIKAADLFASGQPFYLSHNGVWLTQNISPEFIEFES
ncbi:RNA 2'-phosphotransferase [bacterium SCSIO 12741]|nr:RNA 2'-phosphotransferase [bacterium SCSIO 12741]